MHANVPRAVVGLGPVSDTAAPCPINEHIDDKFVGFFGGQGRHG
jgi:hypothetical protein